MHYVLIVDDEFQFCTYFKNLISWDALNCCLVDTVHSGRDALTVLKNTPIDIVFVDMNMPEMNGVDFIKQSHSLGFSPIFIALSGFQDFEFVKESLKNGAVDYILKHNLTDLFLEQLLKNILSGLNEKKDNTDFLISSYQYSIACEIYKKLLLQGCSSEMAEISTLKKINFYLVENGCILILLHLDEFDKISSHWSDERHKQRYLCTVSDICKSTLEDYAPGVSFHIDGPDFAVLFSLPNTNSQLYILEKSNQIISRIFRSIQKMLNASSNFALSRVCKKLEQLNNLYYTTSIKFYSKFYMEKQTIFMEEPISFSFNSTLHINETKIKECVLNNMLPDLIQEIDYLFEQFKKSNLDKSLVMEYAASLCSIAFSIAKSNHIASAILYSNKISPYTQIQFCETARQIEDILINLYETLLSQLKSQNFMLNYCAVTQKAISFILSNYQKPLSLDDVSVSIGVNSAYLSRTFKKDVGIGFVEFLNHHRVHVAKQLLKQDLALKEIVQKTGFSSYNYFFKVFKELVGSTPQEFKNDSAL